MHNEKITVNFCLLKCQHLCTFTGCKKSENKEKRREKEKKRQTNGKESIFTLFGCVAVVMKVA